MPTVIYRDLAEFGLRFVTPRDRAFAALVQEIADRPHPLSFAPRPQEDLEFSAVLLNENGKAMITFAYCWHLTLTSGRPRSHRQGNLGSGLQMDVLKGRSRIQPELGTFFLPGSKRLLTQQGIRGNNLDVLPDLPRRSGGAIGLGAGSSLPEQEGVAAIELALDVAIFEDGLCVGPDEDDLCQTLIEGLGQQRKTCQEIVDLLRGGASAGRAFELLQPLVRRPGAQKNRRPGMGSFLLGMFARQATHHLLHLPEARSLAWFESEAQCSPLPLRRPA